MFFGTRRSVVVPEPLVFFDPIDYADDAAATAAGWSITEANGASVTVGGGKVVIDRNGAGATDCIFARTFALRPGDLHRLEMELDNIGADSGTVLVAIAGGISVTVNPTVNGVNRAWFTAVAPTTAIHFRVAGTTTGYYDLLSVRIYRE